MPRYSDETRNKALLLWNAHLAADQAVAEHEQANEVKFAAIDDEYALKGAALTEKHHQENLELEARQDAEATALEAQCVAAKGMTELVAAANAAEDAWMNSDEDETPDFKRDRRRQVDDNIVRCATSGKPIFIDEDTFTDAEGKVHLAAEWEKTKAAAAA